MYFLMIIIGVLRLSTAKPHEGTDEGFQHSPVGKYRDTFKSIHQTPNTDEHQRARTPIGNHSHVDKTPTTITTANISLRTEAENSKNTTTLLALPPYIVPVATALCALVLVVGVLGNTLVPLVVLRNKDMQSSTNFFLLNISFADLLVILVCLPTAIVELNSKPDVWVMGLIMCEYT